MKRLMNVTVFCLCLLIAATIADAKGMRGNNGNKRGDAGLSTVIANLPVQGLSAEEKAGLTKMREEEKLARDVYQVLYEQWGLNIFNNIARSEQRHMNTVKSLHDKYGLIDPITDSSIGIFTDPEMLELYTKLVEKGKTSIVDALQVGATIEDLDIKDLYDFLEQTDNLDIKTVYQNLVKGSRNHLRAFSYQLSMNGANYEAQYLSASEIEKIINSPKERGRFDENGQQVTGPGRRGAGKGISTTSLAKSSYVDADGDGVCDNKGARMAGAGDGRGKGNGAGNRGKGFRRGARDGSGSMGRTGTERPNYVDADNDGICDNSGVKIPEN